MSEQNQQFNAVTPDNVGHDKKENEKGDVTKRSEKKEPAPDKYFESEKILVCI